MNKLIAITIGDIDGIGIRLLIKEWKLGKVKNFIIISNYKILLRTKLFSPKDVNLLTNEKHINKFNKNKLNILNIQTKNKYTNITDSLKTAYDYSKNNLFIGILTLPLNKKEINKFVNRKFIDQTSYFSKLENKNDSNMIFIYNNKFFIPLTTHIELKKVHLLFKKKKNIVNKIISLNNTLINDFKINKPKMVIAGINPHAGEDGLISDDENKYLNPIIKELKINKININGPVSGDSLLNKDNLNNYDAFIFTYHDQALIPFKLISKYGGVNYTSNLSIIRLSPSHGTAKNMINNKLSNSKGIINCFKLIFTIYKNRK